MLPPAAIDDGLVFPVFPAIFFPEFFPLPGRHLFILAVLALHRLAFIRWQLHVLTRPVAQFPLLRGTETRPVRAMLGEHGLLFLAEALPGNTGIRMHRRNGTLQRMEYSGISKMKM